MKLLPYLAAFALVLLVCCSSPAESQSLGSRIREFMTRVRRLPTNLRSRFGPRGRRPAVPQLVPRGSRQISKPRLSCPENLQLRCSGKNRRCECAQPPLHNPPNLPRGPLKTRRRRKFVLFGKVFG